MATWPFNRNKQQDQTLPEEVQEYYESGRKQQTGMAWLLALATLVVTVLLAVLLFFGGRWVYQKIAGDDQSEETPTQQVDQPQSDEQQSAPSATDTQSSNQQGSSSTSTSTPSAASTPSSTTTPTTGSSGSEIPDTGPGPGGLQ